MSLDIFNDAPGLLRAEALTISMELDIEQSSNSGVISWNIPTPATGCTADNQAYCGMVVLLSTTAISRDQVPTDGKIYSSDSSADPDLFSGDKVNGAMVVGAWYNDRTTNTLLVTDLQPGVSYYAVGYPVDCQGRYFRPGVAAYSQSATLGGSADTHGEHTVVMNPPNGPGVSPHDPTDLLAGINYGFKLQVGANPVKPIGAKVDKLSCVSDAPVIDVIIDGKDAQTYGDLIDALNLEFAKQSTHSASFQPPHTGQIYWDKSTNSLKQWDGHVGIPLDCIYRDSDPSILPDGMLWYNPSNPSKINTLNQLHWSESDIIIAPFNLMDPSYGNVWIYDDKAYMWTGNVWCVQDTVVSAIPPDQNLAPPIGSVWYDTNDMSLNLWTGEDGGWKNVSAVVAPTDPNSSSIGDYWFDYTSLHIRARGIEFDEWVELKDAFVGPKAPNAPTDGQLWINDSHMTLHQFVGDDWIDLTVTLSYDNPIDRTACKFWWNEVSDTVSQWSNSSNVWVAVPQFFQSEVDPTDSSIIEEGLVWIDPNTGTVSKWINGCFEEVKNSASIHIPPNSCIPDGTIWKSGDKFYKFTSSQWVSVTPIISDSDPRVLKQGQFWFNAQTRELLSWNGVSWTNVAYSQHPVKIPLDETWLDLSTGLVMKWDGGGWVLCHSTVSAEIDCHGNIKIIHNSTGSNSYVEIKKKEDSAGEDYDYLWSSLNLSNELHKPKPGSDGVSDTPSYKEEGIGTDGSDSLRKEMANDIRYSLGYPVQDVELTEAQIDLCITRALEEVRQRSGASYKRSFFMLSIEGGHQRYILSDKELGYNKIVDVMGIYRMSSAFMSSAHGAGIYGQIILQQLYSMGTYDLTSHFLMSNYISMMEQLMAARLAFHWDERTRELWIHNRFPMSERSALMEATVERTEQELMTDRLLLPIIRRWATAHARLILAEIRGKFSQLPSASGGVSLNAVELRHAANEDMQKCIDDIESYIADRPEHYGMYDMTWG